MLDQEHLSQLVSLLFAISTFLAGDLKTETVPAGSIIAQDQTHVTRDNPEGKYAAVEKVKCNEGHPTLVLESQTTMETIVHGLLHAAACKADGRFMPNGVPSSLDPTECANVPTDCNHSLVYWALQNPELATAMFRRLAAEQSR